MSYPTLETQFDAPILNRHGSGPAQYSKAPQPPVLLSLEGIVKSYPAGAGEVLALRGVTLKIRKGDFVSILGPSGSGKSTLLHILGLLSRPTHGTLTFEDLDVSRLSERRFSDLRSQRIGFVFQSFHLLNSISALENVELPLIYQRIAPSRRKRWALEALEAVGVQGRAYHFPHQLSGGESQRVAIARALVSRPSLILADEPTGNLDIQTGLEILELLRAFNLRGVTLVIVTHDQTIAREAHQRIFLQDGRIKEIQNSKIKMENS